MDRGSNWLQSIRFPSIRNLYSFEWFYEFFLLRPRLTLARNFSLCITQVAGKPPASRCIQKWIRGISVFLPFLERKSINSFKIAAPPHLYAVAHRRLLSRAGLIDMGKPPTQTTPCENSPTNKSTFMSYIFIDQNDPNKQSQQQTHTHEQTKRKRKRL